MNSERPAVAYIMSRFPKLTETFVLYEMLELRRMHFRVIVLPLRLEKECEAHPEVQEMAGDLFPAPLLSRRTWFINLKWLARDPVRYLRTALRAAAGTAGSLKFFAGALSYFPKAVVFADTAQRLGVAHIHAHFASHPAMAAWMIHQLCGISYSFTAHGTDLHVDQHMLREKARDAVFAVTVSDYNVRFIAERCGEEVAQKFEVIRCGTDLSLFSPHAETKPSGDPLEILCIASFRTVKGHRVLIEACAQLRARGIPFVCRLIGYGPIEQEIVRQIRDLNLTEQVLVEGAKPRPEVVQMLGRADVLVLTSVQTRDGSREGIPVALMEGMACGLPVVASRISGIPELVEEGVSGLLFTPGDAAEAAHALELLAGNPELRSRMGRAARLRVEDSYNLVKNAHSLAGRIKEEIRTGPVNRPVQTHFSD